MAPAVLTLTPARSPISEGLVTLDLLRPISAGSRSPDERHYVADDDHGRHRLIVRAPEARQPLELTIPLDQAMPVRLDAASRLAHSGSRSTLYVPTSLQRTRLVLLLNILDAMEGGLSKREIAHQLVYPLAPALHGAAWKGSTERRRTHRLCLEAARLRDRGFSELLHARLRPAG